jgi:hypothetical protein
LAALETVKSIIMSALSKSSSGKINRIDYRNHAHGNPGAGELTIGCSVFMSSVFNE